MSGERKQESKDDDEYKPIGTKQQKRLSPMAENTNNGGSSPPSPVTKIPQDQLFSILLLLPVESILCFSMTCKKFKTLAYSDSLWESICRRDWGQTPVNALNRGSDRLQRHPWRELYRRVYGLDSVSCRRLRSGPDGDGILPTPRASHSLNLVSGCLVLFGGGCEGGRHLDDTWVANLSENPTLPLRWHKTDSGSPGGRFGHSCVSVRGSLVLFGGINDLGTRHNDTWIGRLVGPSAHLSWQPLDSGPISPPPRGAHAACCIDNKYVLVHGGIGPSGTRLGDTWILDPDSKTWRQITARPSPPSRSGHTLTHVGQSAGTVLFGGRGTGLEVLGDVWLLNSRWEWRQLAFEPRSVPRGLSLPRVGHSASLIVGQRLLIYGGEDSYRNRKDDFWVLDVGSSSRRLWRRVESRGERPDCRSFHGACVDETGRFLYVYGGMVDGLVRPADPSGLRFDGESFLVELVL
ncbi:kelch repeat-containing F-box family protein [Striga asiatica]|uniref:Kelch repeat-containing F-box family protein n=1 Tax=Striga asiatica TaxID=4170 RepID=A0A5A7R8E5_STRAF|nr:kelch repeat-containing F-box family protein [Striga asiatica]